MNIPYFENWTKKSTYFTVIWIISFLGVFTAFGYIIKQIENPILLNPNNEQLTKLNNSKNIICEIDKVLCINLEKKPVTYKIRDYHPKILNPIFSLILGKGIANYVNKQYTIDLSSFIFSDMINLTVVLYHEQQHVNMASLVLFKVDANNIEKCEHHNLVKKATTDFSAKLDDWLANNKNKYVTRESATYYSGQYGNDIQNCQS